MHAHIPITLLIAYVASSRVTDRYKETNAFFLFCYHIDAAARIVCAHANVH
jgi:hypothetical protein